MDRQPLRDWTKIKSEKGPDLPLFEAEFRHMQNPRNGKILKAIVLKVPDTVNVIAVTRQNQLILVEQFRFGLNKCLRELPAGLIDDEEQPLEAARRELMEETGYQSEEWIFLGKSYVNPAYVNNACFHYLALNAEPVGNTSPDEFEDLRVDLMPIGDLRSLNASNLLSDAIGQAAVAALDRHLRRQDSI